MNNPANLKLLTSREKIGRAYMMDHGGRIGRTILQNACAIHDGVDAGEIGHPVGWRCCI
jgi:hypothetical protein